MRELRGVDVDVLVEAWHVAEALSEPSRSGLAAGRDRCAAAGRLAGDGGVG